MRGTPFIFQGDEIGMTNREMKSVSESKDIETLTGWKEASGKGVTEEEFLRIANYSGRDNARTPVAVGCHTNSRILVSAAMDDVESEIQKA